MRALVSDRSDVTAATIQPGWLRRPAFDMNFIGGVTVLALAAGLAGMVEPRLFAWVLFFDVWLLGYHHVVSTFTRLAFDSDSFRQHRFLVIHLPVVVVVATLGAIWAFGIWVLPTAYLYWQWFHYTRQSYGIERIYRRAADKQALINDYVTTRALYLLPLFGILFRSYQQQPEFLGMRVRYLPITEPVLWISGGLAAAAVGAWFVHQCVALARGRWAPAHSMYVLTHHTVFFAGYLLIEDITIGWLVLNVWHNAQYILLVWSFNNNRFKQGVDPSHRFLSTISQTRNVVVYFAVCLAISTAAYLMLGEATDQLDSATAVPVTLVVYMIINFHHYVVDGKIWKVRKPALRKNLGVDS